MGGFWEAKNALVWSFKIIKRGSWEYGIRENKNTLVWEFKILENQCPTREWGARGNEIQL